MFDSMIRKVPAVLAVLVLPAALAGQDAAPPPVSPEVQEWFVEIQEIQEEIAPVQEQALQDPEIQAEQQALAQDVEAAMAEIDPAVSGVHERIAELQAEAVAAQQAGDTAKIQELTQEAGQIQERYARAQTEALAQPALALRLELFQEQLQEKMIEIDPEVEESLERLRELEERIQRVLDGG